MMTWHLSSWTTAGLGAWHDEFSMWFALRDSTDGLEALVVSPTSTQLHLPQEPYNMYGEHFRIISLLDVQCCIRGLCVASLLFSFVRD
eukprot:m.102886 g.102886  ORF g.102886 m.102886 type:complete len:88 (+) comp16829_c0_seq17:1988-2251(+)